MTFKAPPNSRMCLMASIVLSDSDVEADKEFFTAVNVSMIEYGSDDLMYIPSACTSAFIGNKPAWIRISVSPRSTTPSHPLPPFPPHVPSPSSRSRKKDRPWNMVRPRGSEGGMSSSLASDRQQTARLANGRICQLSPSPEGFRFCSPAFLAAEAPSPWTADADEC